MPRERGCAGKHTIYNITKQIELECMQKNKRKTKLKFRKDILLQREQSNNERIANAIMDICSPLEAIFVDDSQEIDTQGRLFLWYLGKIAWNLSSYKEVLYSLFEKLRLDSPYGIIVANTITDLIKRKNDLFPNINDTTKNIHVNKIKIVLYAGTPKLRVSLTKKEYSNAEIQSELIFPPIIQHIFSIIKERPKIIRDMANRPMEHEKAIDLCIKDFSCKPILLNFISLCTVKNKEDLLDRIDHYRKKSDYYLLALSCVAACRFLEAYHYCDIFLDTFGYRKNVFKLKLFLMIKMGFISELDLFKLLLTNDLQTFEIDELIFLYYFINFDAEKQKDNLWRLRNSECSIIAISFIYMKTKQLIRTKTHLFGLLNALSCSNLSVVPQLELCRKTIYKLMIEVMRKKCQSF